MDNFVGKENLQQVLKKYLSKFPDKISEYIRESSFENFDEIHKYSVKDKTEYLEFSLNYVDYTLDYKISCHLNMKTNRYDYKLCERISRMDYDTGKIIVNEIFNGRIKSIKNQKAK